MKGEPSIAMLRRPSGSCGGAPAAGEGVIGFRRREEGREVEEEPKRWWSQDGRGNPTAAGRGRGESELGLQGVELSFFIYEGII